MLINEQTIKEMESAGACGDGLEFATQFTDTQTFWVACPDARWLLWWVWYCKDERYDCLTTFINRVLADVIIDQRTRDRISTEPNKILNSTVLLLHTVGVVSKYTDWFRECYGINIPEFNQP